MRGPPCIAWQGCSEQELCGFMPTVTCITFTYVMSLGING
jgi:hypothetical protein